MHILHVVPALDVGGVEAGVVDAARYLVAAGHTVVVVSGGGRLVKEVSAAGARHYTLPIGKKSLITIIRMIRALSEIIRTEEIDLVHAHSRIPALSAFVAARITGRVFVTTAHGYYARHPLSAVMGWGKRIIVPSTIIAKHMQEAFGVPPERLRLISPGVDITRFTFRDPSTIPARAYTVGIIARMTPLKGHRDFIKAVAIIQRTIPQLRVMIVGDAPKAAYREELELLVKRLGLSHVVSFLGTKTDMPAILRELDTMVMATVTPEAFGRVIIEAQAAGVPVVATRVGGVLESIEDGVTGLLCNASDPRDMAAKILSLYRNRSRAAAIAVEARRRVEARFVTDTKMQEQLAVYTEALTTTSILVMKMSALGDVILAVPSLRALREKFPQAHITVLVGIAARSVLDHCPYINDRIVCDFNGRHRGVRGFMALVRELQRQSFDMVIDLQNNRKSHLLGALCGAPVRYGYDKGRFAFLLNRKIKDDAPFLNPIEHQFRVLKAAGVKPVSTQLEVWPSPADEERAFAILRDNWVASTGGMPVKPLVGINVRASARWITKNWPATFIAELCDRLAKEHNARVVLTGAPADAAYATAVARMTNARPIIAAGKTDMLELASLMKRFAVYLTPDSAPLHIAAAVGVPCIALFGPTDPRRHVPPAKNVVVLNKALKCAPCYSPHCMKQFRCMRKLTVDEVLHALRPYLPAGAV